MTRELAASRISADFWLVIPGRWPIGPPTFLVGQVRVAIRHLGWPVRVQQGNCAAADLSGSAGDRITRALSGETAEELRDFIEELAGAAG